MNVPGNGWTLGFLKMPADIRPYRLIRTRRRLCYPHYPSRPPRLCVATFLIKLAEESASSLRIRGRAATSNDIELGTEPRHTSTANARGDPAHAPAASGPAATT